MNLTRSSRSRIISCSILCLMLAMFVPQAFSQQTLVKNINTNQELVGSSPALFVSLNNNVFYFRANDSIHGTELWRSDGTAEGTSLVIDIAPNNANADPLSLINVAGTLFFTATDPVHGRELWKSDGTAEGTALVADINPGTASSNPGLLVPIGPLLYFTANNGTNGIELWVTDGSPGGTRMLKDINPGGASSNPSGLKEFDGTLFFAANAGFTNGTELWKTDGTSAGTVLVKDIIPGSASSSPQNLTVYKGITQTNLLYFSASTPTNGIELWASDGTTAGTFLFKDINPGPTNSSPSNLLVVNGTLFFTATTISNGFELWKTDGTPPGTVLVRNINPGPASSSPASLVDVNGTLFFSALNSTTGTELWKSDGTFEGTVLVKDIAPGGSSVPNRLINVNGTLFFTATDAIHGIELWKSDGTEANTLMVKDIRAGSASSNPDNLAVFNGTLIFAADDGLFGRELWKSDGTEEGTVMIANILQGDNSSNPANSATLNGATLFTADDGANGNEVWRTDGTTDGTFLLKDINPGINGSAPGPLVTAANLVFFSANDTLHGRELWVSDGTEGGTMLVKDINPTGNSNPTNLVDFKGALFFTATDNLGRSQLWKSDGSPDGTVQVADLSPFGTNSNPQNMVSAGSLLFFRAFDIFHGTELWRSDGTAEGTFMVLDINTNFPSSTPLGLVARSNLVFFSASNSVTGPNLWVSDGSAAGTRPISNFNASITFNPTQITAAGNTIYFSQNDGTGLRLWTVDAFEDLAFPVLEAFTSATIPTPSNLINVKGVLYFTAPHSGSVYLWKVVPFGPGAEPITPLPSPPGVPPINFFAAGNRLFFAAAGAAGRELWSSDGTAAGTAAIGTLPGFTIPTDPIPLIVLNNNLLYSAFLPDIGRELFAFTLNHPPELAEPTPDQSGTFGQLVSLTLSPGTFIDPDSGQTLTFAATGLPSGLTFDPLTMTLSGLLTAAGQFTVVITATDNGEPLPLSVLDTFVFTVNKATPAITWPNPQPIVYGQSLGSTQLNASASIPGVFIFSPPAGTVLHAGIGQTLSVMFLPNDSDNYNSASAQVSLTVLKATLSAVAANQSRIYGAPNPAFTINYSGLVNGDSASVIDTEPTASTTATPASPVGEYPITLSGGTDNDYNFTLVNGVLSITPTPLTVIAADATRVFGQTNPVFTGTISGVQNGDSITATYSCSATEQSLAGTYPITPSLNDPDNKLGNYSVSLIDGTLTITPAELGVTITSPDSGFVQSVNSNVVFTGAFTKSGASETYLAFWTFSQDGATDVVVPGVISNSTVRAEVMFAAAGIYSVRLTITNDFGPAAVATNVNNDLPAYVVIYDPSAGFVTGGGWINSPAGAYLLDPNAVGKASFGFISQYHTGATTPDGQTRFRFQTGDLDFRSAVYQWLVIGGPKAQFKGTGTINGEGSYGFLLTAVDGQLPGGGGVDKFRIKIWELEHGIVVYDTQSGASDAAAPSTAVQGGSIIIQTP